MTIKLDNNLRTKTIAVYGASSNIGSKFILEAAKNGATIIAFARNIHKITDSSKIKASRKITIIEGDITRLKDVKKALRGKNVDATINFAANFSSDMPKAWAVNVTGEQNILKASKEFGVKRHVYISTIATQMTKSNTYRDTKLAAEDKVKKAGKEFGLDWVILRYGNVLGTSAWDQPFKLIIPGLRLAVPKVPTSNKLAAFPYLTIETAIKATLKSLSTRPNQTITVFDNKITIGKYLSAMEKIHNIKKSYLPIKLLQFLNKYFGKYIPPIAGLFAASEFSAHPPVFENRTMKQELQIKTRDFKKWIKVHFSKKQQ